VKQDRLMITVRSGDRDLGRLTGLLSSLADFPPTIPYRVVVLGEPGETGVVDYCASCEGVRYHERERDAGVEIDALAEGSDCNYQLLLHPDAIFANRSWCEAVFAKLIETGAVMMGATPFRRIPVGGGVMVDTFSSWFVAYDREQVSRVGGFRSDCGDASWVAAYLRCRRASMHCVGGSLSGIVVHTEGCWLDAEKTEAEASRDERSLEILVAKEGLL
jgi:hypothetical protein